MAPEPNASSSIPEASTAGESSKGHITVSEDNYGDDDEDEDEDQIGGLSDVTSHRSAEDEDEDELRSSHEATPRRSAEDNDEDDELSTSNDATPHNSASISNVTLRSPTPAASPTTTSNLDVHGDTAEIDLSISAFQSQLVVSNPSNVRSLNRTAPAANEINGKGDEGSGMYTLFSLCTRLDNPLSHKITWPLNLPSQGNVRRA